MEVDLKKKETESGWFDIKGGGRVHVRLLSVDDIVAMRKACFSPVVEYPLLKDPKTGKEDYRRFESEKFDGDLWETMKNDLGILGWDVMVNKETKQPIEVTTENKNLLMFPGVCPSFCEAVEKGMASLKEAEKAKAAASEKNLSPG
jgi:hypothetical protein